MSIDIKKITTFEPNGLGQPANSINSGIINRGDVSVAGSNPSIGDKSIRSNDSDRANVIDRGNSFRDTLQDSIQNLNQNASTGLQKMKDPSGSLISSVGSLKFSNHAIDRMRSRGLTFPPDQMEKLESAVKKAADKGGRDALVLMNDKAVIVSVKNNTVVTVVDKASLKENVFTNIDSTIVI